MHNIAMADVEAAVFDDGMRPMRAGTFFHFKRADRLKIFRIRFDENDVATATDPVDH